MKFTELTGVAVLATLFLFGCGRSDNSATGASEGSQNTNSGSDASRASSRQDYQSNSSAAQPDNTGRNVRDRSDSSLTPEAQGGSDADRNTTQRIRRAITSNDQLSTEAKNIKIITTNGKVTLRGPVQSAQEQKTIDSIVQQLGISSVDDQLEVKAANQ